jgi:hypothetical protein
MGDHLVMYHEFATTTEDPEHTVQQAEVVHLQSAMEVSDIPTSSSGNINLRIFLVSIERISEIQDTLPF